MRSVMHQSFPVNTINKVLALNGTPKLWMRQGVGILSAGEFPLGV